MITILLTSLTLGGLAAGITTHILVHPAAGFTITGITCVFYLLCNMPMPI